MKKISLKRSTHSENSAPSNASPLMLSFMSHRRLDEMEKDFAQSLQRESSQTRQLHALLQQTAADRDRAHTALQELRIHESKAVEMVAELSSLVKEQRDKLAVAATEIERYSKLHKETLDANEREKTRATALEAQVMAMSEQLKDKAASIEGLETVIKGLREERGLWSRELAAQGASLAAERGTLEARATALKAEVEDLRKERSGLEDSLKIKTKMVDDNLDTIRRLKQAHSDREAEARLAREEGERRLTDAQDRLEAESALSRQLQHDLERASERKAELKERLAEATAEVELLRRENGQLRATWQEKGALLHQLEAEVAGMQRTSSAREKRLLEERDAAAAMVRAAEARVRECDLALQRQTEAHVTRERQLEATVHKQAGELEAVRSRLIVAEGELAERKAEQEKRAAKLRAALTELQD